MKKRIAVWLYGGVGTGHFSQGYPMLERLLEQLSVSFEIVVYSQSEPHQNFNNKLFEIRSAPGKIKNGILRWACLINYFTRDHRKKNFQLLFSFWGYPTGVIVTCLQKIFNLPSAIYLLGSDSASVPSINFGILHNRIKRAIVKWAYSKASLVLTISKFQQDTLRKFGISCRIKVVPWGADLSMYKFHLKESKGVLHVIHVGHLTPVKDQATLLKAFSLLVKQRPAELRIFGVDCLQGQMQTLSRELNIEDYVKFLDMIPYRQMPEQYAWADIMLHTSLSEGQSMALTEAAASGVLLAGTSVGLLYDLGEAYGITVAPGDYKKLADKILLALKNSDEWKTKVQLARRWSEQFDLPWTIRKLTELLTGL